VTANVSTSCWGWQGKFGRPDFLVVAKPTTYANSRRTGLETLYGVGGVERGSSIE